MACAAPSTDVVRVFGRSRIDACVSAGAAANQDTCTTMRTSCEHACASNQTYQESTIFGCWERVGSSPRQVMCLGRAFVPAAVASARGDHALARWEGAAGAEVMVSSGQYETMEGENRLYLYDVTPTACAQLRYQPDYGLMTGELEQNATCTASADVSVGWVSAPTPQG